jgi:nitrate/nitrite transport system substrate-binding protein
MRRWGQIAEAKPDSWYFEVAKKVYRPDIYETAAKALIEDGLMTAEDFPDFAGEDGFREPQTEFIDGITFDGSKPNEYLESFPIGLKGKETI